MEICASAAAKIILLGEHAVVYGQPAIAVPFSALRTYAKLVTPLPNQTGIHVHLSDLKQEFTVNNDTEETDNPLDSALKLLLKHHVMSWPNLRIVVTSNIPIASGLGSGASVTTALLRALAVGVGIQVSPEELNDIVFNTEKLFHGTPSGIDNTVIVYEQPIYFRHGEPIQHLKITSSVRLLVANTGISASTKIAVSDVRALYEKNASYYGSIFALIGDLVISAREALFRSDFEMLGNLMYRNHTLLRELTVSSSELDRFVETAISAGAYGAKLSGGGRGGNMIALVNHKTALSVRDALLAEGAQSVYDTIVEAG